MATSRWSFTHEGRAFAFNLSTQVLVEEFVWRAEIWCDQMEVGSLPGALLPGTCHLTAGEKASSKSGLLRTSSKPSRLGWELTGSYPSGWLGAACRFCSGSLVVGPCLRSLPLQEPFSQSLQCPFRASPSYRFDPAAAPFSAPSPTKAQIQVITTRMGLVCQ